MFKGHSVLKLLFFLLNLMKIKTFLYIEMHFVGFIRFWCNQFDRIRVQEGPPVLIFSCPKGLLRVTQYTILGKKCQNTLTARVLEKGL